MKMIYPKKKKKKSNFCVFVGNLVLDSSGQINSMLVDYDPWDAELLHGCSGVTLCNYPIGWQQQVRDQIKSVLLVSNASEIINTDFPCASLFVL